MLKPIKRYLVVKQHILDGIAKGAWQAGDRVPSENELVTLCQVSRMTARRALQELHQQGTLIRIKGAGSYVAQEKQQDSLLQIRSVAAQITQQGLCHTSTLSTLESIACDAYLCRAMSLTKEAPIFHSVILHYQSMQPIQLEYRWVNPLAAPYYLQQDFSTITPSDYLTSVAPVTRAEHTVEAVVGDINIREKLTISQNEAVLLLKRKTWCGEQFVSYAHLYHPGNRFSLGSEFNQQSASIDPTRSNKE